MTPRMTTYIPCFSRRAKLNCHTYTSCATQVMNGTEVSSSAVPASQSRLVDVVIGRSTTMPPLGVTIRSGDSPVQQEVKR
eukprot:scaffold5949_cov90-Skeletonema_marinoi.AAC.3